MILNKTLSFNINENSYTYRTLNETDVSFLYKDGLKENGINLERIPKSLTIKSQKNYVSNILASKYNTICGLFQQNSLIGTCGIQSNTSNSKNIYSNTPIQNLATIGLLILHKDNYQKGFGKILVFSSTYLCCADTGKKHYGARINNNINSIKSFEHCGFIFSTEVNSRQWYFLNYKNLVIPSNVSKIKVE
jgi:hypothetical protein